MFYSLISMLFCVLTYLKFSFGEMGTPRSILKKLQPFIIPQEPDKVHTNLRVDVESLLNGYWEWWDFVDQKCGQVQETSYWKLNTCFPELENPKAQSTILTAWDKGNKFGFTIHLFKDKKCQVSAGDPVSGDTDKKDCNQKFQVTIVNSPDSGAKINGQGIIRSFFSNQGDCKTGSLDKSIEGNFVSIGDCFHDSYGGKDIQILSCEGNSFQATVYGSIDGSCTGNQSPITINRNSMCAGYPWLNFTCGGNCGGNCPSGKCPSCPCGTEKKKLEKKYWCGKYTWNQDNCNCIMTKESGGNPNAVNYNFNSKSGKSSYDVGLWQINQIHWNDCSGGHPPCDPEENLKCAIQIYQLGPTKGHNDWNPNTWAHWATCKDKCDDICDSP